MYVSTGCRAYPIGFSAANVHGSAREFPRPQFFRPSILIVLY